jgi:carboxyl-terminal processing protease
MKTGRKFLAILLLAAVWGPDWIAASAEPVQFQELMDILKGNLAGATPDNLNRAAVAGLLEELAPRVRLLDEDAPEKETGPTNAALVVTTAAFDRAFGYVRLAWLGNHSAREFRAAYENLSTSNKLQGLILDLRFAGGGDYSEAVAVADRFFSDAQDLVDWGEGMKKSTAKSNAMTLPTTVLVNRKTAGAAEVLAGILRHGDAALLVGSRTAGQASETRDFTLKTGQKVRVAIAAVRVLTDKELPFTGIVPDIEVPTSIDEELLSMADFYRTVKIAGGTGTPPDTSLTSTNRGRRRMNEAELVRLSREGQDFREPPSGAAPVRTQDLGPQVTDPVLARALDILKGLAVVQRARGL